MKFPAIILSVYIMALTAMPCRDNHTASTNSITLESSEQECNHSNNIDLCSPFCFCNCCQTPLQLNTFSTIQINQMIFDLTIPSLVHNEIGCIISLWHPPRV